MKRLSSATRRRTFSQVTTNHILWGIVCAGLVLFGAAMWRNVQTLEQQNASLKKQITTLKARDARCTARDTWENGTTKTFSTLTTNGLRQYAVALPKEFDKNVYYPLIIHYSGKGAGALAGAQQAQLTALPVISVYPYPTMGKDGYTAWQGAPYSSGADDIAFTATLLDKVQSQLCIDRARVYATGMSNGGGMVSLLSCQLPGRFAAFGIVAGAMYYPAGACTPTTPRPLINIHGDRDPVVPYGGSVTRRLPDITQWSATRARDNGCKATPTILNSDAITTVTTWTSCRNNATVQNIRQHGGGHLWWPDTTQTLWRFLSSHTL